MSQESSINTQPPEKLDRGHNILCAALRTDVSGLRANVDEPNFSETEILPKLIEEALQNNPDILVTPEYCLYNIPEKAEPISFTKQNNEYTIVSGQPETIQAISRICELAKNHQSIIVLSTVAEKQPSDDSTFITHNTAIIINAEGKIVHLRRKITGTHSVLPSQPNNPNLSAVGKSAALESLKPCEVKLKNGNTIKINTLICFERYNEDVAEMLADQQLDILAVSVREGDDKYTKWMTEESQGEQPQATLYHDLKTLAAKNGVMAPNGIIIAADSANKQAGIFANNPSVWQTQAEAIHVSESNVSVAL